MPELKLTIGYLPNLAELTIISNALDCLSLKIQMDIWQNRPTYDEDAGVYVSENTKAIDNIAVFAILATIEQMQSKMRVSAEEQKLLSDANDKTTYESHVDIEIERSFTHAEIGFIGQTLFHYIKNIEGEYIRKEKDLYESDNHYTGKPLQEFLDSAVEKAKSDRKTVSKLMEKISRA